MKLIEGLKIQRDVMRKIDDLKKKIQTHASYSSIERPVYQVENGDPSDQSAQTAQIKKWTQSCADMVKLLADIRLRIQYTNLITPVTIEVGGKNVTKSIADWIHWRRDFSSVMYSVASSLTDKSIREGVITTSQGERQEVHIVRCYSPAQRDADMEEYRNMRYKIDSTLEIVNATTDMVDELPNLKDNKKENA